MGNNGMGTEAHTVADEAATQEPVVSRPEDAPSNFRTDSKRLREIEERLRIQETNIAETVKHVEWQMTKLEEIWEALDLLRQMMITNYSLSSVDSAGSK